MKNLIVYLGLCLSIISCSNRHDFDSIVSKEWKKCTENTNCTIDFAYLMDFQWDTMCFYSGACSLEDINKDLGFKLNEFKDIGDRVIFLNKGKIVYHKEWFTKPSEPTVGVVFETDLHFFKVSKLTSKFKVKKEGKAYFLIKL